ncbi:MAG TPA: hypothetical protein VGI75_03070 [Pirellulales bacterium]|jgi:hypothetical protein
MPDKPNTAEPQKPRRRWFQFRLRTLLVVVTLLAIPCAYFAHEWRIVEARERWIETHECEATQGFGTIRESGDVEPDNPIPAVRRWMGDEPIESIWFVRDEDAAEATMLFPEADVVTRNAWRNASPP